MSKCSLIFLITFLSGISKGLAQNCPFIGQNPNSAFPVCGTATFIQNTTSSCAGSAIPGPCGGGLRDIGPFWYSFTCYTGGTLGFLITPNNLNDDYDWQVFDITGHNPNDVYSDASLFVACSWSGYRGITGATSAGTSLVNCAGSAPLFSSMPTLIAGHNYLLVVSNFTNLQGGYQLSFTMGTPGGGTAVITDLGNQVPEIKTASANCDGTQIVLRFDKSVKCSSLAPGGSDFIISPAVTILSALGYGCSNGFDMDSVILTLTAPLAPGAYAVAAVNGTDGNTLLDNCDHPIVIGQGVAFIFSVAAPLPMGSVTPPSCTPASLTLTFADPVKCNSIATNGSDFTITGPSAVTVSSAAAVNCNANDETNTIIIQLSAPIVVKGNYEVQMVTGSDGNTLVGQCNRRVTAGDNAPFIITLQTSGGNGLSGCIVTVPSAFTPNDDGLNDYLYPLNGINAENLEFKVFNRWGQLLFYSRDWRQKWDGRVNGVMQAANVYIWTLDFTHKDTREKYSMRGTATLIR